MRLDELVRYGMPQSLISHWRERQGAALLPLQSAAARAGVCDALAGVRRALIAGPTSAGKSFCGELALAAALAARGKGALLVPLKSVAEEKYATLRPVYERLGLRTIIATADHRESDERLRRGDYDIAICVYEKFNRLLLDDIDALAQLSVVVIDELQLLHDSERGALLERLLVKLLGYSAPPRLIGLLSAGSGEEELAAWLDAALIRESARPLELRRGVAVGGRFDYREFNSGAEGSEEFALGESVDAEREMTLVEALAPRLKADAGQSLVFVSSRREAAECALALASTVGWPRAHAALTALGGEEPSAVTRTLAQALTRGVAFHSADLSAAQRAAVERGFRDGEVRVIFCTNTLALGVNLPADTVYIQPYKYQPGPVNGPLGGARRGGYTPTPLTPAEFDSAAGRAGRYTPDSDAQRIARAVIVAASEFERDALWRAYIEPSADAPETPARGPAGDDELVLELIISGLATSVDDLERYFALRRHAANCGRRIEAALSRLRERELLALTASGALTVPRAARVAALAGVSIDGAARFVELIATARPSGDREWIAAALSAPDVATQARLPYSRSDSAAERALFAELPDEAVRLLELLAPSAGALDRRLGRRLGAFATLELWRAGCRAVEIEQRSSLPIAQVAQLGDCVAWLIRTLGEMYAVSDSAFGELPHLRELARSLSLGLPPELLRLRAAFSGAPNRAEVAALARLGVGAPAELTALSERRRSAALSAASLGGPHTLLKKLSEIQHYHDPEAPDGAAAGKETDMTQPATQTFDHNPPAPITAVAPRSRTFAGAATPQRVAIDGAAQGERFLLRIDGVPVALTGKSFKYFVRLAAGRFLSEDGWVYKDDIEQGFNQARYLYRMRREIEAGLPGYRWPVYENNRLGYYRLGLAAAAVEINLEALAASDDFEIAETARALAAQAERRRSA